MLYSPETKILRFPEIGVSISTVIGNPLVTYKKAVEYDFVHITNSVEYDVGWVTYTVPPRPAIAYGYTDEGNLLYALDGHIRLSPRKGIMPHEYSLFESQSGEMNINFANLGNQVFRNNYKKSKGSLETDVSFSQELIYNGRVGDYIKLSYREYSSGMARQSFTQEVQYDLSASKIIAFKDVSINITEATNTKITYEVTSHFKDIY
tara:strand:+ start:259 stop:876 length:618 start_codon:yes stop_codon:yes gene_type:complete